VNVLPCKWDVHAHPLEVRLHVIFPITISDKKRLGGTSET
jgi:hypothetical protein